VVESRLDARRASGYLLLAAVLVIGACGAVWDEHTDRARRPYALGRVALIASNFVPVPASIDSTGATDVTAPLQAFLDHVPNGSVVRFRPEGRYRAEGTLVLANRTLTIEAQHATVFATQRGDADRVNWWIRGGSRVIIRNMVVRGSNPNAGTSDAAYVPELEHQHGFQITGVQGVELDRVEVTDTYGDFVYVASGNMRSTNVWIHDSTFLRNGRQGIAVVAGTNVIIERNVFDQTRRSTIDLEPNSSSGVVSNVFVLDNNIGVGRAGFNFVAAHGAGPVNNVLVYGNQLHGHDLTIDVRPPVTQRRSNWVVANNVSDTTINDRAMRFVAVDGVAVTNNTQAVTPGHAAVLTTDACGTHVNRNNFGGGSIVEQGDPCSAPLSVPKAPSIPGRS